MKPKVQKPQKSGSYDNCQTPPYAVAYLAQFIDVSDKVVWESASGELGLLMRGIFRYMSPKGVHFTDIVLDPTYDRLTYTPDIHYDVEITNPPYAIKYQWIKACLKSRKPFALLVPLETIGSKTFQTMAKQAWRDTGIDFNIILLPKRVNFYMPNKGWSGKGAQFPVIWLTWGCKAHIYPEYNDQIMYAKEIESYEHD